MSRLDVAIDEAAKHALDLNVNRGVPADAAIRRCASAVLAAVRRNPIAYAATDAGVGWSGQALSLVGSSLSVIGLVKTIFGGG